MIMIAMETPVALAIASFLGMAGLVAHNANHIKTGNVHKLRPMNMLDLVRPTFDVWKNTMRGIFVIVWGGVLKWFHILTFSAGKKFLEVAWMVRGKRKLMQEDANASRIWKEVAYEKERIQAHFPRSGDLVQ